MAAAPATAAPESASRGSDATVIALISGAHFFSHFYILALPPLFPVLADVFDVSYLELGTALAALNLATTLTQAPCGFLVDRYGPRAILIVGLVLFSIAIGGIGIVPGYWALMLLMVVGGLGNAVFHPADYAILSATVDESRMGRAFSIHTFAGYIGFALAPVIMVALYELVGWREALLISGAAGLAMAALLVLYWRPLGASRDAVVAKPSAGVPASSQLLLSPPVLMSLLFFVMMALTHSGLTAFSVTALMGSHADLVTMVDRDLALALANVPITIYLFTSAFGVLVGGWVADNVKQHHRVIGLSYIVLSASIAVVAALPLPMFAISIAFGIAGASSGVIAPSRDLMVRAVTPPGQSGKVFGFVMTGFNVGGIIGPPIYGAILDHADPDMVFWVVSIVALGTLVTVLGAAEGGSRARRAALAAAE